MADTYKSANDLITLNDKNAVDWGCSDLFDDAPLIKLIAATVASNGTQHKYLKQTADAGSGFRSLNAGLANTVSTDTLVTLDLKILDASFAFDKAMADAYDKGGAAAFLQREARKKMRSVMAKAEKQIVQGTVGGDAGGFAGLADSATMNSASGSMVINAGGSTVGTGSSVYLIRTNDAGADLELILGQNGNIEIGDTIIQRIDTTDSPPKHLPAYFTPIQGWMGLQLGSAVSVARIGNLTADSGKGLTDALISKALALFPATRMPNLIVMGRRSRNQLQASRTATTTTGAPAPLPDSSFDIPIVVTDAIGVTETLLA